MQTILGAGGAIGRPLAIALQQYTDRVRLVARNPKGVTGAEELFRADLLDPDATRRAVSGSQVVYLTVGLPYKAKIWEAQWPQVMEHVIRAAALEGARIVFFDNNYLYDPERLGQMTEHTRVRPAARKSVLRAQVSRRLLQGIHTGEVTGLIARASDFFGPGGVTSAITELVQKPMLAGKKASWFMRDDKVHSGTYVPDAALATALLGNTEDAYGEVWHLPGPDEKITGKMWVEKYAAALGQRPRYSVIGKGMLAVGGLFSPALRELKEMTYQFDRDFYFDTTKFKNRFPDFAVTGYEEGIAAIVKREA